MSVDPAGDGLVAAVPEYVHYVVLELLKNAMRATMQAHGAGKAVGGEEEGDAGAGMDVAGEESARVQEREEAEGGGGGGGSTQNAGDGDASIVFANVPEVVISVKAHGDDDVMLVVADQGRGIPAEATDKVSCCMHACRAVFWPAELVLLWCCRRRVTLHFPFFLRLRCFRFRCRSATSALFLSLQHMYIHAYTCRNLAGVLRSAVV